jgi:hypothetical protein
MVSRYGWLASDQPELARNVSGADPDDVRRWHAAGQLRAIRVRDNTVGFYQLRR